MESVRGIGSRPASITLPKRKKMENNWISRIETVTKTIGKLFAWLIVPLVLSLCYEVMARYILKKPTIWAFDITYMLMSAIFLIAGGYTLAEGKHIKIDFLYLKFSTRTKAIIDSIGFIFLFLPVISVLAYFSVWKFIESIQVRELSDMTPWHPHMGPFRASMAIGFILLAIQVIAEIIKNMILIFEQSRGEKGE